MKILASVALSLVVVFLACLYCVWVFNYIENLGNTNYWESYFTHAWYFFFNVVFGVLAATSPGWALIIIIAIFRKINGSGRDFEFYSVYKSNKKS